MAHHLLAELTFNFDSERWNEWDLALLTSEELEALAMLLNCPRTGPKERLIVKLLATRQLRFKLTTFPCTLEGARLLAGQKRREDLKAMAAEAGTWKSGNKVQLAASLISWRDRCRAAGTRFFEEQKRLAESKGVQLQLTLA